jgi:hypothetical protein
VGVYTGTLGVSDSGLNKTPSALMLTSCQHPGGVSLAFTSKYGATGASKRKVPSPKSSLSLSSALEMLEGSLPRGAVVDALKGRQVRKHPWEAGS